MKKTTNSIILVLVLVAVLSGFQSLKAQDTPKSIAGEWQATWKTMQGTNICKYTYIVNGDVLTGKVITEMGEEKQEVEISNGKIYGDSVSYTYPYNNFTKMEYKGKINGDQISFTRKAGRWATEEGVVERVK